MNQSPSIIMAVRYGFTLIEMMISIALGSLIVYTAIAGFRVASTSITLVNRLALENAIMRSGIEQAHDRVDFWTDTDNPEDINQQGLRNNSATATLNTNERRAADAASGSYTSGLPFSDMKDVFWLSPGLDPEDIAIMSERGREAIKGWNPQDRWLMNESRTWFHGDLSDNANYGFRPGGYYSVFTNVKNSVPIEVRVNTTAPRTPPTNPPTTPPTATSTVVTTVTVTPPHNWLMGQTMGMHQALGFYAFADYMPANHVYGVYAIPKTTVSGNVNGDLPYKWEAYEYDLTNPLLTDGNGTLLTLVASRSRLTQASQWCATSFNYGNDLFVRSGSPGDLAQLTKGGVFAMVSADYTTSTTKAVQYKINNGKNPLMHQFKYAVGHAPEMSPASAMDYNQGNITTANAGAHFYDVAGASQFQRFLNVTEMTTEVIPGGGPAQWPKAKVSMKRYITEARFVNLCSLRWTSPITGASAELNFTTFGTSLRGARQQRASQPMSASAAAGWAKWYGPGDSNNSLTLDGKL